MNNLPQVTICLLLVRLIAFLLLNIFIFSLSFAGVRSISSAEWGVFGNAEKNDNIFEFPASALSFAGFWYEGASSSPFTFSAQGQLTFTASVPDGQTARVYFRFEKILGQIQSRVTILK